MVSQTEHFKTRDHYVMHVLAGDIGGTSTRLCIADCAGGVCRRLRTQRFASARYDGLAAILREYLQQESMPAFDAVCMAIAGPVRSTAAGQTANATNLPWVIESGALAQTFGFPRVRLINDFEAIGYGLPMLGASDVVVLQKGDPVPYGPRALIGAGTGLGQAVLFWQGDQYTVIPTEGGHADFGPVDDLQIDLARYLLRHHGRASYELILSGSGLVRLYAFLRERGTTAESPTVMQAMQSGDPAAAITQAALHQEDPLAQQALDLFVRIYGAQAGNLALTAGATGGIDIAGGIAPKIISAFGENFLSAFRNKGTMSHHVRAIPVRVITNTKVGLLGAMLVASRMLGDGPV
jgi:glucokinase